jgi:uncharacterized protein YuzE
MNVRYDREEDILVIKVTNEPIDYAEEIGNIIVHFTKDGKAVLFEILDATEFLANEAPNHLIELERARLTLVANPKLKATTLI